MQYHNERTEYWAILSGTPKITIGESVINARRGDEFKIASKIKHRVESADSDTEILEISFGEFIEGDVVRLEDKYGRA